MNTTDNAMVSADFTVGNGVSYTLTLHYRTDHVDTYPAAYESRERVGYVLRMHDSSGTRVIFDGDDFRPSPSHSLDGPEAIVSLLGFLSLGDGDTDADYFKGYTAEQLAWRDEHAEALSMVECDCTDEEGSGAIDMDRFNATIGLTYH